MKKRVVIYLGMVLIALGTGGVCIPAQDLKTQAEMHARVGDLYNFSPHKLSKDQQKTKSQEMDRFWDEVKRNPEITLQLLRHELGDLINPAFFFVDGSMLLLSLSDSAEDGALVLEALSRTDLRDVDPTAYFHTVHVLSMKGLDTTKAALHILDEPEFMVNVPMHAMTLSQGMALMYLLIPTQQERWMSVALARFHVEKNERALMSIMALLYFSQSPEGDQAIEEAAKNHALSESVRKDAEEWLKDAKEALKAKYEVKGDERQIREERKKRMGAVSDEALGDVMKMTGRLIQIRKDKRQQL